MKRLVGVVVAALISAVGLSACGDHDTTKKACESLKDVSFNSVVGPLYDGASDSFKRLYDKVDGEPGGSFQYYSDVQRLSDLCAQYGVKNAAASMAM